MGYNQFNNLTNPVRKINNKELNSMIIINFSSLSIVFYLNNYYKRIGRGLISVVFSTIPYFKFI